MPSKENVAEKSESPEKNEPPKNRSRFEIYCKALGINPNLLMLKITLFMMYGASASLIPFLTIHMQSIGLTVEEIAIIYLALPLTTFLSPPITGFVVDRFGHYKLVVVLSLVLNGVFHHSLMLIPQMETPGEMPVPYVLRHPHTGKVEVWWSPCPSRECPQEEDVDLVLDDCLDHCTLINKEEMSFLVGVHQSIAVRPPTFLNQCPKGCEPINPNKKPEKKPTFGKQGDDLRFHFQRNGSHPQGWMKKKGPSADKNANNTRGRDVSAHNVNNTANTAEPTEEPTFFIRVDMHEGLMDPVEHLGIEIEPDDNETMTDFRQHFTEEMLTAGGVNFTMLEEADLRCGGFVVATNLTYDTLKELAADCMLQICKFREGGPDICPPDYKESAPGVFWIYFVLRFLGTTMLSASVTVMDPIALTMVQQYGGEFGRERLFSTIGMAIFSPITGILIDYSSRKLGYTDYSAAFYTYSALMAVSSLSVLLIPIGTKLPADNLLRDMMKLLGLPHVIMFIFYLFLLGNCWGFIESYLFLYLKELGASNYLLGITISVGTLSSIPFLYGAEKITKKVGHVNLIVIAFFAHALRLMGYSYIDEAWWCFPFEAIESVSVHLLWVAAATYCNVIAPKNLLATLIGVLGMAHFSLGRGSGSFFGGVLIGTVGTRQAFRLMGLVAVVGGFTYGLLHFFWLHKYSEKPDKKEESASESETLKAKDDEKEEADELSTSLERLSLMIRFNHRGSLASLTGMCS
ncbi:Major facilitator superfamily domain containing [Nesidiocoris tenuis]|uniref:Major facilitator superfamily domain containing n=1 Tax=Nesidiocoris tenuis TaxID=355587 RepID=A0ABN7AMJ1_9HEMI|nr:Major facilitator superfamily domain containing [Nesidiocoris tenuis]